MKDKLSQAREFLLDGIENGRFRSGEKLPGARELAMEVGVSFLVFQHAVSSLEQDGVLECIPRRGAYVREGWEERLLRNHVLVLKDNLDLPWLPGFQELMGQKLPELRFARRFRRGMFELRVTLYLQAHRDEYMDLAELMPETLEDESRFYQHPFQGFREVDGRLFGIPFIFSPRVMLFNRTMLAGCGLPEPTDDWSWEEFLEYIRVLRKRYSADQVFHYNTRPHFWMNFIFRAGGKLVQRRPDGTSEIHIDSPATIRGIACLQELRRALFGKGALGNTSMGFWRGGQAFTVADREFISWERSAAERNLLWSAVALPSIPGGSRLTAQATDLICVRKECADNALARKFIHFLVSEQLQHFIGSERYGIPMLKAAAERSFDSGTSCDRLLLREMKAVTTGYNVDSPTISNILHGGISRIIASDAPPEPAAKELASAIRTILEIRNEISQEH